MEKTLEQLQAEFMQIFEKEVPVNKKNDTEWITSKIAEAQKAEEENNAVDNQDQQDNNSNIELEDESENEFEEDENRFNTEEDEESDEVVENEDYDDNSVDNQVMTQEARNVGNIVYPI